MTGISTGRPDYDALFSTRGLSEGEPVFIIKAHDKVGGDAIRAYAALAHRAGAPPAATELALQQADAFDRWPEKRVPKGPALDDAARKQLAYQLGRRAWTSRATIEDHHPLLADKLASDAIASRIRPTITALIERIPPADRPLVIADPTHPLHDLCRLAGWDLAGRIAAA
ncbi:hypothetical protein [Brevundimonas sp.]|uniref:hypothetical protein n=1 Tax=Brevundimonas sp. TaxID=1871086 RepID=UPI0027FDD6A6|nr:hypothetical protein [Brevundimonas sp.]MDQ7813879.1 hypothetical protein [Brevundimonas sp.]